MNTRWPISLTLALLVTLGLAAATAAGIQTLLPLMMSEPPSWLTPRWLQVADVLIMSLTVVALARLYRRWRGAMTQGEVEGE